MKHIVAARAAKKAKSMVANKAREFEVLRSICRIAIELLAHEIIKGT